MSKDILKTSEEWQKLKPNPVVYDPDGWDRKNFQFSWYEELITEDEYTGRMLESTCMIKVEGLDGKRT